jgi:hypothetical protein
MGTNRRLSATRAAGLLFAALVTVCGIGVHLVAELAALGWRPDSQLIFSARHIPLAVLGLAALVALAVVAFAGTQYPKRSGFSARIVRALPDGGCGARFLGLAFLAQIGVFALTEAGEGLPIGAGDVGLALVAAVCAGAVGAVVVLRSQRRLIEALARIIVVLIDAVSPPAAAQAWKHVAARVRTRRCRSIVFAGSRRPPPSALVIEPLLTTTRSQEPVGVHFSVVARPRVLRRCVC